MGASCGICAVTSVLKYYGEEESYYDMELSYLNDYIRNNLKEDAIKVTSTTVKGHCNTLSDLGYTSHYGYSTVGNLPRYSSYEQYLEFMKYNLKNGRPIVVSTYLGSWHFLTVIGIDDMGTDCIYDDVVICADSSDCWDGYQDGYDVFAATKFFSQHSNNSYNQLQEQIVIYPNN
jgi:hypothetical protein